MTDVVRRERLRSLVRLVMALTMVSIGLLHFPLGKYFVQIVPPQLPQPMLLVWLSGVVELALGLLLLPPGTRRWAGYGLVALYVAVFPANIYMAAANVQVQGAPDWFKPSPLALWLRLPLQLVFIAGALWVSREPRPTFTTARSAP